MSVEEKANRRKSAKDIEVDDGKQLMRIDKDGKDEGTESEDSMDVDEEMYLHIPRLKVKGDKQVCHIVAA